MQTVRFKILGFDVDVQPAFFMLLGIYLLFGLRDGRPLWTIASFCAVVFVSIVIHELGHATMARRLKVRVYQVALHGFGGHVLHAQTRPRSSLLISLAGPGVELAVGLPVMLVWWSGLITNPAVNTVMWQWVWVNVFWALVNLLPMRPLDGGQALAAWLEMRWGSERRALRVASQVGTGVGGAFAVLGFLTSSMFVFLIGAWSAWTNYQTLQQVSR